MNKTVLIASESTVVRQLKGSLKNKSLWTLSKLRINRSCTTILIYEPIPDPVAGHDSVVSATRIMCGLERN